MELSMSLRRSSSPPWKNSRIPIPQAEPPMENDRENTQDPVTISAISSNPNVQCMSKTIGSGNFPEVIPWFQVFSRTVPLWQRVPRVEIFQCWVLMSGFNKSTLLLQICHKIWLREDPAAKSNGDSKLKCFPNQNIYNDCLANKFSKQEWWSAQAEQHSNPEEKELALLIRRCNRQGYAYLDFRRCRANRDRVSWSSQSISSGESRFSKYFPTKRKNMHIFSKSILEVLSTSRNHCKSFLWVIANW